MSTNYWYIILRFLLQKHCLQIFNLRTFYYHILDDELAESNIDVATVL
jgi:hypothetical protein